MFPQGINKLRSSAFKCLDLLGRLLFFRSHLRLRAQIHPGQLVTVQWAWPFLASLAAAAAAAIEGSACIGAFTPGQRHLLPLQQACYIISALLFWLELEHSPIRIRVLPSFSIHVFCCFSKKMVSTMAWGFRQLSSAGTVSLSAVYSQS